MKFGLGSRIGLIGAHLDAGSKTVVEISEMNLCIEQTSDVQSDGMSRLMVGESVQIVFTTQMFNHDWYLVYV